MGKGRQWRKWDGDYHTMVTINKLMLGMIFLMAILPMVSATDTLGTFKQNDCVNLIQTCSNCTEVNITNLVYPNSSIALNDVTMTKVGTAYNYTYCGTSIVGTYFVSGTGDLDGLDTVWTYTFEITPNGESLSVQQRKPALLFDVDSL